MKKLILLIVYVTITMGQLIAQIVPRTEIYRDELNKVGIEFTQPKGFTEINSSIPKSDGDIIGMFAHPLFNVGCIIETPKSKVVYTSALRYAFSDEDILTYPHRNAMKVNKIRYFIKENIAHASEGNNAKLNSKHLTGQENNTPLFKVVNQDSYIFFIDTKEATKRFNADSILVYTIPVEGYGDFKYCTSMLLFKNPWVVTILTFLSGKELKNQDKHLAKLNQTIWFSGKKIDISQNLNPNTDTLQIPRNTDLSKRILKLMQENKTTTKYE